MDYPLDLPSRESRRREARERIFAIAFMAATNHGRSMKCEGKGLSAFGEPLHAHMPGGCKNDGTGCLCECHDVPDALRAIGPAA